MTVPILHTFCKDRSYIISKFNTLRPRQNGCHLSTFSNSFFWNKCWNFDLNFTDICSLWSTWQGAKHVYKVMVRGRIADNLRHQSIIWINDGFDYCCLNASPGHKAAENLCKVIRNCMKSFVRNVPNQNVWLRRKKTYIKRNLWLVENNNLIVSFTPKFRCQNPCM